MCVVREGDLDVGGEQMAPGRVIMNNSTISIFSSAYSFDTVFKSFDLMYTIVKKEENGREDCFDLTDSRDLKKTVKLCIMQGTELKGKTVFEFRNDWIKDIVTFRDDC